MDMPFGHVLAAMKSEFIALSDQSQRGVSALIDINDDFWRSFICELDSHTTCNSLGMSLKSSPLAVSE